MPLHIFPWRPSRDTCREIAESASTSGGFNYPHVGATRDAPPLPPAVDGGWALDHARVRVGSGRAAYEAARDLVRRWGHFQLGWTDVDPATPVAPGAPVCVRANTMGAWSANPLRVVYVEEGRCRLTPPAGAPSTAARPRGAGAPPPRPPPPADGRRFAFAHGCLGGHLLAGEERFAVEWDDRGDGGVYYDIFTFSRPGHPLAALAYPLVRHFQQRFAADSTRAMQAAVAKAAPPPPPGAGGGRSKK